MAMKQSKIPGPGVTRRASPRTSLISFPVWYQPEAPLGSAVKYIASLSPKFNWVGIYVLRGKWLELGPYIGAGIEHARIPVGRGIRGTAIALDADQNVADVAEAGSDPARGPETRSELVVLIRDRSQRVVGQVDIDSHTRNAFGSEEREAVRRVANELGELWPE